MTEQDRAEEVVSQIVGDRCCVGCGYNLVGRPVVREPVYRLLIVRCPECGAVSPMQEYPSLSRWSRRWAALLAGLWLVAMLGFWALGSAAVVGSVVAASLSATSSARELVSTGSSEWISAREGSTKQGWWQATADDAAAWWALQGGWEGFAAAHGGAWALVDWLGFGLVGLIGTLVAGLLGIIWSVAALNLRRRTLVLLLPLMLLWAALFATLAAVEQAGLLSVEPYGYLALTQPVHVHLGLPLSLLALVMCCIGGGIGLIAGRSILRGLLRVLLPWPARAVFSVLWTAEGLPPPRPDRRR